MRTISIDPDYASWRDQARQLLAEGAAPETLAWTDRAEAQDELFGGGVENSLAGTPNTEIRIPRSFLDLAKSVACHSDPARWALLYRLVWRIARDGERHLLQLATDPSVVRARKMSKEIGRDLHKMRAFVRFRKVGESEETGREQFVAWFEPSHHIVRLNAPFFQKRFTGMDWSILTPELCAHWNGQQLTFTDGVPKSEAPDEDALEDLWRGYYKSIFNPARLKLKAMQAEMPVKYWKNLPEAPLIQELTTAASARRDSMILREPLAPQAAPKNAYLGYLHDLNAEPIIERTDDPTDFANKSLDDLKQLAACCRACPLWDRATQMVFGEGPEDARIMIIGEQPGDEEDLAGKPFIGPAGQLLDQALERVGLNRDAIYVTNAVKHFKWKPQPRGKRRLHDKANRAEMHACRPWLLAEIEKIQPDVIITLGNTPAQSIVREDFRILKDRGIVESHRLEHFAGRLIATVHPSVLLRLREKPQKQTEWRRFLEDLKMAKEAL